MKKIIFSAFILSSITIISCKDKETIITPDPASSGSTVQLEGNIGDQTGSSAGNSIFIDFSEDKMTAVRRQAWDLAFNGGNDFYVKLNNTTAATAYVTSKTELSEVSAADTVGVNFTFNMMAPDASMFNKIDDIDGDISKNVIPNIAAVASDNKVVILNRGIAGNVAPRDYMKIKITRNAAGGYTLQYAPLNATAFKSVDITKDANMDLIYVSLDEGNIISKPAKNNWDIQWTYSIYKTAMSATEYVPYAFSDLVEINYLNNTKVIVKEYDSETEAATAFENYSKAQLDTESFSSNRWYIGSNWRRTAAPGATVPAGTIKTKFYVIKDHAGNAYKVKFISFTAEDGGERGRPEIKYVLIK